MLAHTHMATGDHPNVTCRDPFERSIPEADHVRTFIVGQAGRSSSRSPATLRDEAIRCARRRERSRAVWIRGAHRTPVVNARAAFLCQRRRESEARGL